MSEGETLIPMHRTAILRLLNSYSVLPLEPHEAAIATETIRFVETHVDCLLRTQTSGHVTASAWVVNAARTKALLTHHRKLGKWLQLGGHADGDEDLLAVALREVREDSGLKLIRPVTSNIFDLDLHWIPERSGEPRHLHYDLRFLIEGNPIEPLLASHESNALVWIDLDQIAAYTQEPSIIRMARKLFA